MIDEDQFILSLSTDVVVEAQHMCLRQKRQRRSHRAHMDRGR